MSKLAKLSLANRSLVALLSIGILAFGLISTVSLKQELIPSLQFPGAFITTVYPGASPEIVEREVTEPIESAIGGTDGLETYTSTSSNGMSVVQAQFAYGTDVGSAVQDIQQSLNRISTRLPEDADPIVGAGSTDDFPVVLLAVASDKNQQTLVDQLNIEVIPELEKIDGVREASVTGGRTAQVTVDLDEKKLAAKGISVTTVTNALQANGVAIPGGDLTQDGKTIPVEVGAQFESIDQLKQLPLMPTPTGGSAAGTGGGQQGQGGATTRGPTDGQTGGGQTGTGQTGAGQTGGQAGSGQTGTGTSTTPVIPKPVPLGDVATVKESLAPTSSITRTDGKPSLGVNVTKLTDANTVTISHEVQDKIADFQKTLGDNTKFTVVFDQAPFIEESVEGLTTEGLIGLLMAVVVILIFLLSLRSTLVTAVSIPFSLLVAMIGLYTGGYSLNILTLGALTVAIGRVVDDSIVVLENIKRHLAYGEEKLHAILAAVREVAGAVTASTITTVGVFLPIAFVGGQVGELFRPFAVTVTISLLASLLVSLTIIPVLSYWFLRRPKAAAAGEEQKVHDEAVEKERRSILQRIYVPVITWTTKHKIITILAGILVFVGTMAMTPLMKTNFLDNSGQNLFSVTQTMPVGTSLASTDAAAKKVENVLADTNGVKSFQVTIGSESFGGFSFGGGTNEASFNVTTDDALDPDQQTALQDKLRKQLDGLNGAGDITVGTGGSGFGSSNLEVIVKAPDSEKLKQAAQQVEAAMKRVKDTTDISNNLASDMPGIKVDVDRAKAAQAGLSDAQIGQAVRQSFQGQQSGSVIVDGDKQDIVVEDGTQPGSLEALRSLEIPTPLGTTVKLDSVADVSRTTSAASLSRIDGDRSATISATPTGSNLGAVNADLQKELDALKLPSAASWELGGVSSDQGESFAQLGLAMLAAILIVFAVMVATFRSFVQALILLVSIPFAATGALGLLLLTDVALGVPALIGMLMLIGIVVTNAIVLIDLINQYRTPSNSHPGGMPLREAVIEGGRRRLRPILMTAIATIAALVPMALGLTGGGVFISKPLAIVVIGGLISSTLLTLVLVPTLYSMVEGFKERRRAKRAKRRGVPVTARPVDPSKEVAAAEADVQSGIVAPVDAPAGAPAATPDDAPVDAPVGATAGAPTDARVVTTNGVHAADARVANVSGSTDDNGSAKVTIEVVVRNQ